MLPFSGIEAWSDSKGSVAIRTVNAMEYIWNGIVRALQAIGSGDSALFDAALRSLWISVSAVLLAGAIGIPFGVLLAKKRFFGNRCLVQIFRAGMAVPTVFVGIVCFAMLSRRGPLGPMELLYTPWAIVLGEFFLALPIIISLTHGAIRALDQRLDETAMTLGANRWQRFLLMISEARTGVTLAVLSAFARCITELGIAMIVGGNLKGRTRTLSTATALETSKGELANGLAMGFILLLIALGVALAIGSLSREDDS